MSIERMISEDLMALAIANRAAVRPAGPLVAWARERGRVAREPAPAAYVASIGRAASGGALLAYTVALWTILTVPEGRLVDWRGWTTWQTWWHDRVGLGVVAIGAAVVATCARAVARGRARKAVRPSPATAERWALVLGIAGTTAFVVLCGVVTVVVGLQRWSSFWYLDWVDDQTLFGDRQRDLACAIPAVVAAAVMVGRSARVRHVLAGRAALVGGLVVGVVTLLLGFRYDAGILHPQAAYAVASGLRTALTASGTSALFVVVSAIALRGPKTADVGANRADTSPRTA